MNRLTGQLLKVSEIEYQQKNEMFTLFSHYFPGVSLDHFCNDFKEKTWVILMKDRSGGRIRGFSTQMIISTEVSGKRYHALFSGDTIIDKNYWGDKILMSIWGRLAFQLMERFKGEELYWLLICMGYKTYRFLPLFFHKFYPRYDQKTPEQAKSVLNAFGKMKFCDSYDQNSGIVRLGKESALRSGVADITSKLLSNPHIHYFTRRNPGHAEGDELACLVPLKPENFNRYAMRMVRRGV